MNPFRARGVRRLPAALPMLVAALLAAGRAEAAPPPTLPDGYVRLVDDTGAITVVVPETWTETDTVPTADAAGPVPYISASPDHAAFERSFDVPGLVYSAIRYREDLRSVIDQFGLTTGCAKLRIDPYDDGVFVGLAQIGTSCGSEGMASWTMVAANPSDNAFTAAIQVQAATAADDEAMQIALQTFDRVSADATTVSQPGASVPAGLEPVEVATMFLDALAAGDGATACALLTAEEMTINFVDAAETCAAELSLQVAGQGAFWSSVEIAGDENTSSPGQCGDEDPADEYVSLELQGPRDDGCLSISVDGGEWRIEDLSNSIWNQAAG
jgi:hypothetical protein